jgi:hypothetical protein
MRCATICTDAYVPLLEVFLTSVRINTPAPPRFHVLSPGALSTASKDRLLAAYPDLVFAPHDRIYSADNSPFAGYLKFDCFNPDGLGSDEVIYFDADLLCLKDLAELWSETAKINTLGMVREEWRPEAFNAGLIVVKRALQTRAIYRALCETDYSSSGVFGRDQRSFNCLFRDKIQPMDARFNVLTAARRSVPLAATVMLHYIYKPTVPAGRQRLTEQDLKLWESYAGTT